MAYVFFGDLELGTGGIGGAATIETDDEFGYGAGVGVDVPFGGGGWFVYAAADYLAVDFSFEGSDQSLDFDPFIVRAGFGVGF